MCDKDMDGFLPLLSTTDTKQKLSVGNDLLSYLQNGCSIECSDIGLVVDSLVPWINSSNFKVSQMGLDLMTELAVRMGSYFKPYIPTVLPAVVDRLGDSKELVRERCQMLLLALMEHGALTPQQLFERLNPGAFSHKNTNVRDEVLRCLSETLNQHGAGCVSISKLVPSLVKLLSDPSSQVRDTAVATLANIYRHVGDRLRNDLIKKHNVPPSKLPSLLARFDELKAAGDMLPTALNTDSQFDEDEVDRVAGASAKKTLGPKRNIPSAKSVPQTPASSMSDSTSSKLARSASLRKNVTAGGGGLQAGAVDEEGFLRVFEDVPSVQIYSTRDLDDMLVKIRQVISDTNQDWNKRVDALKKVRSLLLAGANNYDEFYNHLRLLDPPFQLSVKDLRSQVVREACVTIAFMSQQLGHKMEHFAESMLPVLFNLIQSSAKVIASAGQVAIGFVVTHTHSPRLIPFLCSPLSHKSRDIRRAAARLLHQVLSSWSTSALNKHVGLLQTGVQSAISDADQEVRMTARKTYWAFRNHFPDQAEALLNSLDASYKRTLHSDSMSNSSSSNSLHQPQRSKIADTTPVRRPIVSPRSASARSNSAIDLQAAQRAKARAQYAALARQKVGSNASLPRPKKTVESGPSSLIGTLSPERTSRQRSRVAGVSQSQPSSRSGSPSSRLNYATYGGGGGAGTNQLGDRSRRSPSYSRSTTGSRETSPCRYTPLPPLSKLRARTGSQSERPPIQPSRPVMAQRILQQSLEAENALADALSYEPRDPSVLMSPRRLRGLEDHSDDSETSSVCSERSFESHRRTSDSFSWSGSQQRLYREMWEPAIKDITEILHACESTHWSDRKDGLVSLSVYLQAGNTLTPHQLSRITDNFTKMLSDSHTKVFSLFLDTVNDLIVTHHADLHSWLYILLTRLFNKLGGDLLGSIQTKIHRTLQVVRDNFGSEPVLHWALRFLIDTTQTPNAKVKLTVLQFIAKLAPCADPSTAFPPSHGSSKDITTAALTKMIGWTMGDCIKQGSELRRGAQEAILALFNLNTPQVTMRFAQLPKEYQEAAATLIQGRVRKSSIGPAGDSPSKHLQQDLSPDQVYRSLRRTTAEIQSYSYEVGGESGISGSGSNAGGQQQAPGDTASHDSGISQMSLNDKPSDIDLITNWTGSMSLSSPTRHSSKDCNGIDMTDSLGDNGFTLGENGEENSGIGKLLDTLEAGNTPQYKPALKQLSKLIRESSCVVLTHHFKRLLRVLLSELGNSDVESKGHVLSALCEMMKKRSLSRLFQSYVELVVLRVVQAYSDQNKEVVRNAELCAGAVASVLQSDLVIKVLTPLISTEEFPVNLAAIKTLTKLVEARPKEDIMVYLPDLMPGLVQAYGNDESLVRKAAVFCMVALHKSVGGDTLKPYLSSLNTSKLKLLHLYINRTQNGSQSPKSSQHQSPT